MYIRNTKFNKKKKKKRKPGFEFSAEPKYQTIKTA